MNTEVDVRIQYAADKLARTVAPSISDAIRKAFLSGAAMQAMLDQQATQPAMQPVATVWLAGSGHYGREACFGSVNTVLLEQACEHGAVQVFLSPKHPDQRFTIVESSDQANDEGCGCAQGQCCPVCDPDVYQAPKR